MYFQHDPALWRDFPDLVPGVLYAAGITADAAPETDPYIAMAKERLADGPESEFPEIQAWRRAFARMGLKPTQYRCAAESLLRRFRKEGSLPRLHPLVDLCNAVSLAFAVPVAVLDADQVAWPLEVRYASGHEDYLTFGGEVEHPAPGEVIFADQAGQAHARRWTNRQSGRSAVSPATSTVLIVAEALHEGAATTIAELIETLAAGTANTWTSALRCTTCRSATRRRTTGAARTAATSHFLIKCDLFVSLRDVHCNAIGILPTLTETLALALIKRPGSGEVWRRRMRSQGKH